MKLTPQQQYARCADALRLLYSDDPVTEADARTHRQLIAEQAKRDELARTRQAALLQEGV